MNKNKWICTDPDNDQFRLDEGKDLWKDKVHTFKQDGEVLTIDLDKYDDEYILSCISSYGYRGNPSIDYYFINGISGPADKHEVDLSIIAECIFELEIS